VPQHGWAICPEDVRGQVAALLEAFQKTLGANLIGVYLHGSLAMGCFNPASSDLDLLVITEQPMSLEQKRAIAETLLRLSRHPASIEISFLSAADLTPWRYPTPFDLHYSEGWRERYEQDLAGDAWQHWNDSRQTDADLAAHITITRARGICLLGRSIAQMLPPVPRQDYIASIWGDFLWARARATENPPYFILNACRIAAYLTDGRLCSKEEAGAWALNALPADMHSLISQALSIYRGEESRPFDTNALEQFGASIQKQMEPFTTRQISEYPGTR
jgi:predicted nucleotidyltransferase